MLFRSLELPASEAVASASEAAPLPVVPGKQKKQRKGRKGKAPKAGGAEETGYFDTVELLGLERVQEMEARAEEGREWRKEAEIEWGIGGEGRDIEVRVVGMSAHGAFVSVLGCVRRS